MILKNNVVYYPRRQILRYIKMSIEEIKKVIKSNITHKSITFDVEWHSENSLRLTYYYGSYQKSYYLTALEIEIELAVWLEGRIVSITHKACKILLNR